MIVSTSLSEIRALFLSWRGAILATCNNQLPLITSNRAVQSRYRSHSETTILVFQGDQISGDIDYRSKCLYWFIMIIRWFTATQMKCSDRFGISDGGVHGVPRLHGPIAPHIKPIMVGWLESQRWSVSIAIVSLNSYKNNTNIWEMLSLVEK